MRRRRFLAAAACLGGLAAGARAAPRRPKARVVVVGGGFAGATAARYLRLLDPAIEVVLVEPAPAFVSCPLSNLVVAGLRTPGDITLPYSPLARHGVRLVRDRAARVDPRRREVHLERSGPLRFDRAIVAPGIDFMWEQIPGLRAAAARRRVLHAWQPGPQAAQLHAQLEAMPADGVFAISIPERPFRCAPAPYERACLVAGWLAKAKPRARVLVLDANGEVASMPALFRRAWSELYAGIVDYRPNSKVVDIDAATGTLKLELEDVGADVLNVLPPMKAAAIAAPFVTIDGRWCGIDWLTYESLAAPGVHVLGDALMPAPAMAKSAHMANGHGKACAAAVVALIGGRAPNPAPTLTNACYSFAAPALAMHVASVHKYDPVERTMRPVPGAGGVSRAMNAAEVPFALDWARNIWEDTLG